MTNPRFVAAKVLGMTLAAYAARKTELIAFLDANDDKQSVNENIARSALTIAVSDRAWNHLVADVGVRL